jgi:hypothetical protein
VVFEVVSETASAVPEAVSVVFEVVSAVPEAVSETASTVSTVLVVGSETVSTELEVVSETASASGSAVVSTVELTVSVTPSAAIACTGDHPSDTSAATTHKTEKRCARTATFVIAGPYANASSMPCLPDRSTVPSPSHTPVGRFLTRKS